MPRKPDTARQPARRLHLLVTSSLLATCLAIPGALAQAPQPKEEQAKNAKKGPPPQQQKQQKQQPNGPPQQPQAGQQPQRKGGPQAGGQQQGGGQQPRFLPPKDGARQGGGNPGAGNANNNPPNAGAPGRNRGNPPPQQGVAGGQPNNPAPQPKFLPRQPGGGQAAGGNPPNPGAQQKFLPPKQPGAGGNPPGNPPLAGGRPGQPNAGWPPKAGGNPPGNVFIPGAKGPGGGGPIGIPNAGRVVGPGSGPRSIDDVKRGRVETVGANGARLIKEPGNRTIIRDNNRTVIVRNETTTIQSFARGAQTKKRRDGIVETVYSRPGGYRVYTEVDNHGRLVRRYGVGPGGRNITYVDNRRFYRNLAIGAGVALAIGAAYVALSPPAIAIPRNRYIVEYRGASYDDCYEALSAPPVEVLDRRYSLEEIRYSEPLRARMRRVDLDTITFEFGSFEVGPDQYPQLENIARAMGKVIESNPAEVFLIEGHTDKVGSEEDNLSLSDRRAETVARILVEHFNVPIENLVTQGYGEQFPKVSTEDAERANRRVTIRRITPLLSQDEVGSDQGLPPPPRQ